MGTLPKKEKTLDKTRQQAANVQQAAASRTDGAEAGTEQLRGEVLQHPHSPRLQHEAGGTRGKTQSKRVKKSSGENEPTRERGDGPELSFCYLLFQFLTGLLLGGSQISQPSLKTQLLSPWREAPRPRQPPSPRFSHRPSRHSDSWQGLSRTKTLPTLGSVLPMRASECVTAKRMGLG